MSGRPVHRATAHGSRALPQHPIWHLRRVQGPNPRKRAADPRECPSPSPHDPWRNGPFLRPLGRRPLRTDPSTHGPFANDPSVSGLQVTGPWVAASRGYLHLAAAWIGDPLHHGPFANGPWALRRMAAKHPLRCFPLRRPPLRPAGRQAASAWNGYGHGLARRRALPFRRA